MYILAIHGLLGLSWDEWAQIFTIAGTFVGVGSWLNHLHNMSLKRNFKEPMSEIGKSVRGLHKSVDGLRTELKDHAKQSAVSIVKLKDKVLSHEERIGWLENHMPTIKWIEDHMDIKK